MTAKDKIKKYQTELKKLTKTHLNKTKKDWQALAGVDEFNIEYGARFALLESWIASGEPATPYALISNGKVDAIIEIIYTQKNKSPITKLLTVDISPEYWDIDEHREKVVELHLDAIQHAIDLAVMNGMMHGKLLGDLKLYGRTDEQLSLLKSIHAHMNTNVLCGDIKGRWLHIKEKSKK